MPAYSFKERFVPKVKSGEKRQTIRKKRKGQAKPGDTVYLYFGMRTKWCTKIGEGICTHTDEIKIHERGTITVNGKKITKVQKQALAVADGFENFETMHRWWKQTHELPFVGDIIHWELKRNCKNKGTHEFCTNDDLKSCRMKSSSHGGNVYEGSEVLLCRSCRAGVENGQFKIIKPIVEPFYC